MWKNVTTSIMMLLVLSFVTGIAYPLGMTGLAQILFPVQANGSLLMVDGKRIGSKLIGQNFTTEGYFHGRPSHVGDNGYDAASSSGSNFGPTNKKFKETLFERLNVERQLNILPQGAAIPSDLVLASASGLDPHITPASAVVQVERVAKARGLNNEQVAALVTEFVEGRQLGLFGEERVNVLELNLALDRLNR